MLHTGYLLSGIAEEVHPLTSSLKLSGVGLLPPRPPDGASMGLDPRSGNTAALTLQGEALQRRWGRGPSGHRLFHPLPVAMLPMVVFPTGKTSPGSTGSHCQDLGLSPRPLQGWNWGTFIA